MNSPSHESKFILLLLLGGLFSCPPAISQQSDVRWSTFSGGAGQSTSGNSTLISSPGEHLVGNVAQGNIVIESGFFPGYLYENGIRSTLDLPASVGWNMISLPFVLDDYRKTDLFPTATTRAYSYDGKIGAYRIYDTLQTGTGYWVKFASPANVLLSGLTFRRDTVSLTDKWNMIAPGSRHLLASKIAALDSVTLVTNFYGYFSTPSAGYRVVDTLEPGRAYWIKVHNPGRVVLNQAVLPANGRPASIDGKQESTPSLATGILSEMNQLVVRDSSGQTGTLYFAASPMEIDINKWELPPQLPSEENMDVRFATGRMLEVPDPKAGREIGIQLTSAIFPLTVSWQMIHSSEQAALRIGNNDVPMKGSGSIEIKQVTSAFALKLEGQSGIDLPKQFALHQNYPNPFNPSTTLRYDLPVRSNVRLIIYNILGQEVYSFVDGIQEAGFHSVRWNAANASSGVYFYRMTAAGVDDSKQFVAIRKMILVK